jgi:protein-disulfide isomerase
MVDDTGSRCLGPRIMICLENDDGYARARHRIFEEQSQMTKDRLYEIASAESGIPRAELEKCAGDPATEEKVKQDIAYAMEYGLEGTPLVVVNGKVGSALPPFFYAIISAGGELDHSAFAGLPPPRPSHAGHDH